MRIGVSIGASVRVGSEVGVNAGIDRGVCVGSAVTVVVLVTTGIGGVSPPRATTNHRTRPTDVIKMTAIKTSFMASLR